MKVAFDSGVYICRCTFDERSIPKEAGFHWNVDKKIWYTSAHRVALVLEKHFDESAKSQIKRYQTKIIPWEDSLSIPESETLMDFQIEAAKFSLSRDRSYLALDPGLGKTPIAAVITSTLNKKEKIFMVYICPPFLTRNTQEEFRKWAPEFTSAHLGKYVFDKVTTPEKHFVLVPDSIVLRTDIKKSIYDLVTSYRTHGFKILLIVDETHRFKNAQAKRTKALFGWRQHKGIADFFDKVVYLSGTPMPNRPIELYPVLSHSAPETIDFSSYFEYGMKYCAGFRSQWGWDFTGASKIDDLAKRVINRFMLRTKKGDVLKSLPPKTEELVILGDDLDKSLQKFDSTILKKASPEDLMKGIISFDLGKDEGDLALATYRRELGIYKIKDSVEFIKYYLEETEESLLVFAHHKAVIEGLKIGLEKYEPLIITGDTPMALRHEHVKTFQEKKERRLFIGNIQAAGVGLTLTKATRVIFVEFSWVPAENDQASDRAHRIGQRDNVFVQYLVYKNSIDRMVLETLLRKKRITEKI